MLGRDGGGEVSFRPLHSVDSGLFNDGTIASRDEWSLEEIKLPR